jgi:T5SS/PEP-CTERM-associated repeat protein
MVVAGAGSVWSNSSQVYVGYSGVNNSLVISNGGKVIDNTADFAHEVTSFGNSALVTGAGSVWTNQNALFIGDTGPSNRLVIQNGGLVSDYWGLIGEEDTSTDNSVVVESGGVWRNQQVAVGDYGSRNSLLVNGGTVYATNLSVGYDSSECDNLVQLDSGEIDVTNSAKSAVLEVYRGTLVLNGGTLRVDHLIVTNECARFVHLGGTLIYKTLELNPAFDADGDGMPNGWEQAHGLDPLNPSDASADPDGDGICNLQECLAATNPTNAQSRFMITSVTPTNGDIRVSWKAVGGKSYVVQTNSGAEFSDASPVISMPGVSEGVTNYIDAGAAASGGMRLYRVRIVP